MQRLRCEKRRAVSHGRWLLPVLALVVALAGFPGGPLRDDDHASLYRSGADVPLPTALLPDPTATSSSERALLNIQASTVTPQPVLPTATSTSAPVDPTAVDEPVTLSKAVRDRARGRAEATYEALWEHFYLPDERLFRETAPHEHWFPYSYLWPLSQTLGVSNEMAAQPDADPQHLFDVLSVVGAIERYFDADRELPAYSSYIPPPYGHENDRFYDDNAWIGLELVRAYELTGYELALVRAGQIFDYLVSGWDASEDRPNSGGVFWVESQRNRDRNTVSTAPAAKLGLLLAAQEDDPLRRRYYLDWSKRMYDWVDANLRSLDGLYWDHVSEDGTIDETIFTYNQGAMLGTSLLLHRATGDERYLDRAEQIGQAALARWDSDGLLAQPIAFNAILFGDLLELDAERPDPAYVELIVTYADRIWAGHRDAATGLVTINSPTSLLDQSAAARIYAMLAGYGS
ncbi:MAG: glycoside hydrolase family 76 protein [Chloroflexota bacterium]|nr:glycoside hydrolase family 76 protein [Chloroflexota bacterium]